MNVGKVSIKVSPQVDINRYPSRYLSIKVSLYVSRDHLLGGPTRERPTVTIGRVPVSLKP
jgi:hypothetical protein